MVDDRIKAFIEQKANELADRLAEALPREKDATGALRISIHPLVIPKPGGGYILEIRLLDYYKFVDEGRKPGTRPPLSAILKWFDQKRFVIHPKYGIVKSNRDNKLQQLSANTKLANQIAWGISTKIFKDGIKPTNFFSATIPPWIQEFKQGLQKELGEFIVSEIKKEIAK